jgi:hypothetical protein
MRKSAFFTVALAVLGVLSALSAPARAGLGGDIGAVEEDRHRMAGVMKPAVSRGGYTVFEISTVGRTVREYVTSDGKVFAITWQGASQPDLSGLLGDYYAEFSAMPKTIAGGRIRRAHHELESANVRVERSGHLRDARGRAYVKPLPEGVSADEIR